MAAHAQWLLAVSGIVILMTVAMNAPRGRRLVVTQKARARKRELAMAAMTAEFRGTTSEDAPPAGRFDGQGGSVFCQSCGTDFPAGTPYCIDCGSETVDPEDVVSPGPPASASSSQGANDRLVVVHIATSPVQASLFKMYLESHAIDCLTRGHVASSVYPFSITPLAEVQLLVRESDSLRARSLLQECQ